jgi:hypothetical protein
VQVAYIGLKEEEECIEEIIQYSVLFWAPIIKQLEVKVNLHFKL